MTRRRPEPHIPHIPHILRIPHIPHFLTPHPFRWGVQDFSEEEPIRAAFRQKATEEGRWKKGYYKVGCRHAPRTTHRSPHAPRATHRSPLTARH